LISPAQFIPIAEECRLIVPIGEWVLGEACRQAQRWAAAGLSFGTMAVNVSAMQFREPILLSASSTSSASQAWTRNGSSWS
jgi:EAL domain-containing protein (putative c-di-GMP-specific phosphodiesterase class I)